MDFVILPKFGHYEVYLNGEFFCTADNYTEAEREIEEYRFHKVV